jgi:2-polyprenyl-3-methyl-5-hydroxy-6-metoxy-1,4-benzoquinol methylase
VPSGIAGKAHYEFEPDHPLYGIELDLIGRDKRVLEFGCAIGHVTRSLVERGCKVVGLEVDPEMAAQAEDAADEVLVTDLNGDDFVERLRGREFDVALFGDVLEHLQSPVDVLLRVKELLAPDGYVVVSLPNVAHVDVKLTLLRGSFEYRDMGLLDRTHLRFFTRSSIDDLLAEAGYLAVEIHRYSLEPFSTELHPDPDVPQALLDLALQDPDSTTYQFIVKAVVDTGDEAVRELAERSRRLADEVHALTIERQRAEAQVAERERELQAMRDTRVFRYTSGLRSLYRKVLVRR